MMVQIQFEPPYRAMLTTTEFDRLGSDILESLDRESAHSAKELHGRLQPIWSAAYYINLTTSIIQNALDGLVRARMIRFVGMGRDLMVPASSGRGDLP